MKLSMESVRKRLFGRETTAELEARKARLEGDIQILQIQIRAQRPLYETARDAWYATVPAQVSVSTAAVRKSHFHTEMNALNDLINRRMDAGRRIEDIDKELVKRQGGGKLVKD